MFRHVLFAVAACGTLALADPPAGVPAATQSAVPATRPSAWAAVKPTTIKLTVDAADVNAAAAQLTRQLGTRVSIYNYNGPVHFAGEEKPYAAAVVDFLQQTGMTPYENGSGLTLTGGKPLSVVPLGDTAALIISRLTSSASRSVLSPQPTNYSYSARGVAILDPALTVIGLSQNASVDRIKVTPDGARLSGGPGFDSFALYRALSEPGQAMRVEFSFNTTARLTKIDLITGRLKGWRVVDEAAVDVSFDQIAEGQPVEGAGVTATVTVDGRAGRQGALTVALTGPAMDLYKSRQWQQGLGRLVSAIDIEGGVLPTQVYNTQRSSPNGPMQVTLRGDNRGGPGLRGNEFFDQLTTIKVRVPTKLKAVNLPFEIHDLDLSAAP